MQGVLKFDGVRYFENIDVVPTLVSFAVASEDEDKLVSTEFKNIGHRVYAAFPLYDKDFLPDYKHFNQLYDNIYELFGQHKILAASAITKGGVAEAAVRTAYEFATGEVLQDVDIKQMRGTTNRSRDIELDLKGTKLVVRVVSTLKEAEKSIQEIKDGKAQFQMLEVMACPGGCINGGGQPRSCDNSKIKQERAEGLYKEDTELPLRKSHMNPSIQKLYQEYLEHPNSHKAHEILHTVYTNRFAGSYKDI